MQIKIPLIKFSSNIGFILLGIITIVFLTVNVGLLIDWQREIIVVQKAAEETARPAEIAVTVVMAEECQDCFNTALVVNVLKKNAQIKITKEKKADYDSELGKALVKKYNISRVPFLVIGGEIKKALGFLPSFNNLGKTIGQTFVVENLPAPYLEIATNKVHGRYTLTYITDKLCDKCYNVTVHRQILAGLAAKPFKEQSIDWSEPSGKKLIADYDIEKIPTIILNGDMEEYTAFQQIWPQVGTTEQDGTYVFRAAELVGTYFDLKTGKVVVKKVE